MSLNSISWIQGLSLGLEHTPPVPEEKYPMCIVMDLFFIRFIFVVKG